MSDVAIITCARRARELSLTAMAQLAARIGIATAQQTKKRLHSCCRALTKMLSKQEIEADVRMGIQENSKRATKKLISLTGSEKRKTRTPKPSIQIRLAVIDHGPRDSLKIKHIAIPGIPSTTIKEIVDQLGDPMVKRGRLFVMKRIEKKFELLFSAPFKEFQKKRLDEKFDGQSIS
ncbi:unnamed protein product, partial [Mesorhabditis belari]|uniref:Uncharacterized protein n=1 Tax=Mesorhabditis belari TaxID=2138241 RepID=A0AAF3EVH8_9BILA